MKIQLRTDREYGLDILRCLSMLGVIVLHILNHGGLEAGYAPGTAGAVLTELLRILMYPAVNCFVLLSGYLLADKNFRLTRLIRIWIAASFWSVVIQCLFYVLDPGSISAGKTLFMFLPLLSNRYWFLNAYTVMLLASPVLNKLLRELAQWQLKGILLVSALLFCVAPMLALGNDVFGAHNGFSFSWFLVVYMWGGYLKWYCAPKENTRRALWLVLYFLLCFGQLAWVLLIDRVGTSVPVLLPLRGIFEAYTSIPVAAGAICLLMYFRSVCLHGERKCLLLQKLSPLVLSVYLIHEHPLIRDSLIRGRFSGLSAYPLPVMLVCVAAAAVLIFVCCVFLDFLREKMFAKLGIPERLRRLGDSAAAHIVLWLKGTK